MINKQFGATVKAHNYIFFYQLDFVNTIETLFVFLNECEILACSWNSNEKVINYKRDMIWLCQSIKHKGVLIQMLSNEKYITINGI